MGLVIDVIEIIFLCFVVFIYGVAYGKIRFGRLQSAQRKPGHWIIYTVSMLDGEDCKCSECGQTSCAPHWNFCPNCGAKMEGCEQE